MSNLVQPILASTLYETSLQGQNTDNRLNIGLKEVDEALRGGFDHGRICCISGEEGTGKTTLCMNVVTNHIISSEFANVAVVEATAAFDVLQLHQSLCARLKALGKSGGNADSMLEKVKIMRAFDFFGIVEALDEIKDGIAAKPPVATHVSDSDEEGEEMLLEWPASPDVQAKTSKPSSSWLLVFLGFGQIANALFKRDFVQGQAILSSFMHTLSLFASNTGACVILTNPALSHKLTVQAGANIGQSPETRPSEWAKQSSAAEQPSIFASNESRPSLAKALAPFVDLHILVSLLPKTKWDAQALYGKHGAGGGGKARLVPVLEVIVDRWSDRTGRWCAFEIARDGSLKFIS